MAEERKIGLQLGSGNCALASFRVLGKFATSDVIRLNDGRSSYTQMPSLVYVDPTNSELEVGRDAKLKYVKLADRVHSPLKALAEGQYQLTEDNLELPVEQLLRKVVAELREQAGLFGDFSRCSVAYPEYLTLEQLAVFKQALRSEIPELEERNFIPASFAVLFDMQLHPARYNLGYHQFDFSVPKKVLVVDIGENFTTASLFELTGDSQELEARYLAKPCSVRVGGKDFDKKFAEYLMDRALLNRTLSEQQLTPELQRQFQLEAEKFKRDLVEKVDAQAISTHLPPGKFNDLALPVRIYGASGKTILTQEVTKGEYDTAVFTCVAAIHEGAPCVFQTVADVFNSANLKLGDLDEVVLVGGMAKVHVIGQVFRHIFGKTPREFANPELSAVRGAAIYHDMISNSL